jgi:hypothetical protein
LLARQRLIDDALELAFTGSVESVIRDGKVIAERRRRDPRTMLASIERLGTAKILANPTAQMVAQEFDDFLDCMAIDAEAQSEFSAQFIRMRLEDVGAFERRQLSNVAMVLGRAAKRHAALQNSGGAIENAASSVQENSKSV